MHSENSFVCPCSSFVACHCLSFDICPFLSIVLVSRLLLFVVCCCLSFVGSPGGPGYQCGPGGQGGKS